MTHSRRRMLAACVAGYPAVEAIGRVLGDPPDRLGIVIHSYANRGLSKAFADPIAFVEHCADLGASSVQVGIGVRDEDYCAKLIDRVRGRGISLEGIVSLPRDESDVDRFEAEIRTAKRVGATIVRTVTLSGRRYETFDSLAAFRAFAERAEQALRWAAPIVTRHGVRLAVENHKDWRADALIDLLDRVGCDHLGVCLDTGNSIALLEDPHEVVEMLAPRAFTTHFKDMAVAESRDGFRLAEVPLGTGFLDLARIVQTLKRANPEIAFNLEMITRDPLSVPCLSERYWTTFPDLAGRHLARTLTMVREKQPSRPLPEVSRLSPEERVRLEDDNVASCLRHAREHLLP